MSKVSFTTKNIFTGVVWMNFTTGNYFVKYNHLLSLHIYSLFCNWLFMWDNYTHTHTHTHTHIYIGFQGGPRGKESAYQCKRHRRLRFESWVEKIPWGSILVPVFLPGKFHGKSRLAGTSSPWTWLSAHTQSPELYMHCSCLLWKAIAIT